MCTSQDFVNFICTSAILPRYLQTVFVAERPALLRFAKGAVHLTVYFPEVKAFHVRLPPLAEQHRIVAKVDALTALIDQFEARLTAATDLHAQFAAAAVHHLDA
jgi:type I restriction enzyme S subunit